MEVKGYTEEQKRKIADIYVTARRLGYKKADIVDELNKAGLAQLNGSPFNASAVGNIGFRLGFARNGWRRPVEAWKHLAPEEARAKRKPRKDAGKKRKYTRRKAEPEPHMEAVEEEKGTDSSLLSSIKEIMNLGINEPLKLRLIRAVLD